MKELGIDHEEILSLTETAIMDIDPHTAIDIIANMNPIQKKYVQALLVVIMAADGEIHEREMIMLQMLTMTCGLPRINMNDINYSLTEFRNMSI